MTGDDVRLTPRTSPAWRGNVHNADHELHKAVLTWLTDETGIELGVLDIWVHVADNNAKSFGPATTAGERAIDRWLRLCESQRAVRFNHWQAKTAMQRMIVRLQTEIDKICQRPETLSPSEAVKLLQGLKDSAIRWNEP